MNKKEISSGAQKAEALADNGKKPAAKKNTAVKSTAKAKKAAPVKQTKDNAKTGNKVMSIKKSAKKEG